MSEYYAKTGSPATSSSGSSAVERSEFAAIEAGTDKLPTLAGNGDKLVAVNAGATALTAVSAGTARANLGLVIGTNVQAYDADLTTWAGVTPGTGVATALAVNVGSAGAPVVNGGALGTPSSGTLTNATGLPAAGVVGTAAILGANTFTGDQTLAENAGIVLDAALSADGKYSGIVQAGTSAAALAFGEVCYRVTATGKWALAKADVAATSANQLGMCVLAAAGADAATTMLLFGKARADALFDTFTVAAPVYLSAATAGKTVSAAPTGTTDFVVRKLGFSEDANTVFFCPSNDYITLT